MDAGETPTAPPQSVRRAPRRADDRSAVGPRAARRSCPGVSCVANDANQRSIASSDSQRAALADAREERGGIAPGLRRRSERWIDEERAPLGPCFAASMRTAFHTSPDARRAKADRVRQAGRDGDAVMREAGRQIEHVAGPEDLVGIGPKRCRMRRSRPSRVGRLSWLRRVPPSTLAPPCTRNTS